ncbi:MAG: S16 family serine protease [Gaiellaceae bacterium]
MFAGLALLAIVIVALWLIRSRSFLLLPDKAHPVGPLVHVQGGRTPSGRGGIYFVDVLEQRASLLDELIPGVLHDGATLVPAQRIVPPGMNDKSQRRADLQQMLMSQRIAAAVALRKLGYHVTARPSGILVDTAIPNTDAVGKLQATDVIISLEGRPVRTFADLRAAIRRHRIGDAVRVGLRRGSDLTSVDVRLTRSTNNPALPALGVVVEQANNIKLPIAVNIDAGNVGGPSAGLAFALEVMEKLGRDVDHGYRVAATGELATDGTVIPIGGVEQKIFGARLAKVDVFLVPAGDNARTARLYAKGVRVVAVQNFQQALRALATLPPKV